MKFFGMRLMAGGIAIVLALGMLAGAHADNSRQRDREDPIVIGHRGASGYVPEHTLAAYYIAILQAADYVEPDLVITKDGVLVARHENEIGGTTDVSQIPEFASRRTTKTIDGVQTTGWFTEDFTLAELKTLRAKERIPQQRPANTRFDGMFEVPTFEEVLALVQSVNEQRRKAAHGRDRQHVKLLGIYPETKHPTYFQGIGLPLEEPLVRTLNRYGYNNAHDPVYIQSFEVANLRKLSKMTKVKLVQLLSDVGAPWDFVVAKDPRTYADLAKPAGLKEIAQYASGIGANKNLMIPRVDDFLGTPTSLVRDAHDARLIVHGWTYRAENSFLPREYRAGADPNAIGDLPGEIKKFLDLGMDGFFTDQPDIGVKARDEFVK
jgi:glycerophosphoryl diester phosphodiesterase